MRALGIAFFGTDGQLSRRSLQALVEQSRIVAVIRASPPSHRPPSMGGALRRSLGIAARALRFRTPPLARLARAAGAPQWEAASGDDATTAARLAVLRPDLICIAGYPWLLPAEVFALPPLGAVNLHASLLPRHRGILPLFWIYYRDDRETGVTLHRVSERPDAGDILFQDAYPLPRGFSVERLNERNAEHGAALLQRAVGAIARGEVVGRPQDETRATPAPFVAPGRPMVDFAQWEVERVWHFLAGLYPWFREPLRDRDNRSVRYRAVRGYRRLDHVLPVGTVERVRGGYALHCRGGVVDLC